MSQAVAVFAVNVVRVFLMQSRGIGEPNGKQLLWVEQNQQQASSQNFIILTYHEAGPDDRLRGN